MKIAFDLDGTLDRHIIAELCRTLIASGWDVHIITGVFREAGDWQGHEAKRKKLTRLGIPFREESEPWNLFTATAQLHILDAVPETYDREYRLADLGLRKGELCERLGIRLVIDDSAKFCDVMRAMSGDLTIAQLR